MRKKPAGPPKEDPETGAGSLADREAIASNVWGQLERYHFKREDIWLDTLRDVKWQEHVMVDSLGIQVDNGVFFIQSDDAAVLPAPFGVMVGIKTKTRDAKGASFSMTEYGAEYTLPMSLTEPITTRFVYGVQSAGADEDDLFHCTVMMHIAPPSKVTLGGIFPACLKVDYACYQQVTERKKKRAR